MTLAHTGSNYDNLQTLRLLSPLYVLIRNYQSKCFFNTAQSQLFCRDFVKFKFFGLKFFSYIFSVCVHLHFAEKAKILPKSSSKVMLQNRTSVIIMSSINNTFYNEIENSIFSTCRAVVPNCGTRTTTGKRESFRWYASYFGLLINLQRHSTFKTFILLTSNNFFLLRTTPPKCTLFSGGDLFFVSFGHRH